MAPGSRWLEACGEPAGSTRRPPRRYRAGVIRDLLAADAETRRKLLEDPRWADVHEIALRKPVSIESIDPILGAPALAHVRSVRGITLEAFIHLCLRRPPLPLERVEVVLSPSDAPYTLGHTLTVAAVGLPALAHLEIDARAATNPNAFPGNTNHVLGLALARSLQTFATGMKNGKARYAAVDGGWAAEVQVEAEPAEPFARLFGPLTTHVKHLSFHSKVPFKTPGMKKQIEEWQAATGGELVLDVPKRTRK
jgi:hypothetical protein